MFLFFAASLTALTVGLGGCSTMELPKIGDGSAEGETGKEARRLDLRIVGNTVLNSDSMGRSYPVMVKVYELKSYNIFATSDFFSLQRDDKAALSGDLLQKNEILLHPGKTVPIKRILSPEATAIGIIAEFRDLPFSDWREVYHLTPAPESRWYRAVIPRKTINLNIEINGKDIRVVELD